ncbi:phytoene/squalene synthase family protein [Portibacter lacus]|uniref:Phytoene synthase n=1 Tax=Portibacter lacus TaxID=1099794 RepID=A0AA37ST18_9BACT|nr:phytoene/squalene synthase family protein [Portibacter lacus]GLR17658.1 phytoene synthase [Portibacter lacus]
MLSLYTKTCEECSHLITKRYSTSFSLGILAFEKKFRAPIYNIYGFVRFADEIVDTFHGYDKKKLLDDFKKDAFRAIDEKLSLNPVLHAFQKVVNEYQIDPALINAFLKSMEMDLYHNEYCDDLYEEYIYGSAEVVGLMCLKVFCHKNDALYEELVSPARSLGAAFQKINFLRDMKSDFDERGRVYFPGIDFNHFDNNEKLRIESDIKKDFDDAYKGIIKLPREVRFGVHVAYVYYLNLFEKIKKSNAIMVKRKRIRVNDGKKMYLFLESAVRHRFNLL